MPTFIKTGFWEKTKKGYREWLNLDQFVESKIPASTYKVFTALLTQSGGDDVQTFAWEYLQPIPEFPILLAGVTYYIDSNQSNTDFTIAGSPNNDGGTSFVANGTQPNWQPPFEIEGNYIQIEWNTGAPVATVLENTIGNVWFSYSGVGQYLLYSNNAFITGKTWNTKCLDFGINGSTIRALLNNNEDLNTMNLLTESDYDIVADGILYNTPIEIRVYN